MILPINFLDMNTYIYINISAIAQKDFLVPILAFGAEFL